MNKAVRALLPLVGIFLFVFLLVLFIPVQLKNAGLDTTVLVVANILFFSVSILTFYLQVRGIANPNPHVFVRSVMGGMLIKMLVCLAAVVAYVYYSDDFNKRSVFLALFLYLIYLSAEVFTVMKLNKKKNA